MLIMKRFLSQVSQQISQRLDEWQDSLETDSRLSVTDLRLPMPKGKKLGILEGHEEVFCHKWPSRSFIGRLLD